MITVKANQNLFRLYANGRSLGIEELELIIAGNEGPRRR